MLGKWSAKCLENNCETIWHCSGLRLNGVSVFFKTYIGIYWNSLGIPGAFYSQDETYTRIVVYTFVTLCFPVPRYPGFAGCPPSRRVQKSMQNPTRFRSAFWKGIGRKRVPKGGPKGHLWEVVLSDF